jgi:hypothetical protein
MRPDDHARRGSVFATDPPPAVIRKAVRDGLPIDALLRAARLGALAAAALGAVLLTPAAPAAADQPPPPRQVLQDATGRGEPTEGPTGRGGPTIGPAKCTVESGPVVCIVEVPVPRPIVIRDRATEMLHLGLAAGLGAALAAGATAARQRRRPPPTTGHVNGFLADDLIDITDIVQSRAVLSVPD